MLNVSCIFIDFFFPFSMKDNTWFLLNKSSVVCNVNINLLVFSFFLLLVFLFFFLFNYILLGYPFTLYLMLFGECDIRVRKNKRE